jgi:hypothetical protein
MSGLACAGAHYTCVRVGVPCTHFPGTLAPRDAGSSEPAVLTSLEARALDAFEPVSPELLAKRDLLQRVDTKYLLPRRSLPELLAQLGRDYRVLYTGQQPSALYLTQYLDTPSFDLFHDHRRGKRLRFKVRVRHYIDRRLTYLEVKGKSAGGGTRKSRRSLGDSCHDLSPDDHRFVTEQTPLQGETLRPSLMNQFRRITLVGIELPERITLDMDLEFQTDESRCALSGVLIAEIKQPRLFRRSPAMQALARCRALPGSTSKYCVGTMLLRPELRHNRLLPTLARIERVSKC